MKTKTNHPMIPEKFDIEITLDDLAKGDRNNAFSGPVSLSVVRALNLAPTSFVSVNDKTILVHFPKDSAIYTTPLELADLLKAFNTGDTGGVRPGTFNLARYA